MEKRGTGSHDHPIERKFSDIIEDEFLAILRAHMLNVSSHDHSGLFQGNGNESLYINNIRDVSPAVANINS
jgi:hypothetical protein